MYKLYKNPDNQEIIGVQKNETTFIPTDPDNTDYQQFLKDIKEGVELLDADGNTMSAAEAQEYIATLH